MKLHRAFHLNLALSALVGFAGSASAGTLLVDFDGSDNDGPGPIATAADFQSQDPAVELAALVNQHNGDVIGGAANPVSGLGVNAIVTVTTGSGFNQGAAGPRAGVPILDGYLFASNSAVELEVSSLEEIPAGQDVLVTIYGVGDASDQDADITLTYDGVATTFGPTNPDGAIGALTSDAREQFTFTKLAGVDSFSVSAFNVDGRFNAVNGFSMTFVPEPCSAALLGLGAMGCLLSRRRA